MTRHSEDKLLPWRQEAKKLHVRISVRIVIVSNATPKNINFSKMFELPHCMLARHKDLLDWCDNPNKAYLLKTEVNQN